MDVAESRPVALYSITLVSPPARRVFIINIFAPFLILSDADGLFHWDARQRSSVMRLMT